MSAAPGAVKAVAPPPKGDAAPAKGQGGGGAPPKAGSAAPAKGSAGGGRGSGNSTPKPTSSGSLRAVAPPNRSATAVQPGARPSTPPPVKPMPAGGSKNAKPAAKPLTPEQQRAQDLAKAARAKALMPVINLHSSHTVADEQAWGDLAQTKNLLQRGGDLFVGDGFARYDEARSKLQAVYDRGVNGQTSVADAKQQMAQLMGQYRQGHQEQMQGYRDRANVGSYTVVPVLRGLEMGSNASTAILVTMKTGSWQAGWAASMAKRTTQDFAIDWLYNKSPIAHFYDRGLSQYTVAPASEKRVVENAVGSLGDAIFGGTLTSVTAAVTAKLTPAIGTKLLGINVTEKLIPRIAGALAFPAGNLARTPTDLGGTWAQQQFAARDIEQQITELNNGHGAGREQVRSEQARAVEAQRGVYMQQFGAAVLREARAQLRQTHAQVPGLLDQETARIAQELKDPNSKLVQQGRTQFEQKKSELVEQAASSYDKKHIAAVQAGKKQIQDVHANTPKLLQEQLWSTIQSLPVAALTGWAFGAAPNSARPMTPAEIGSRNLLTRPLASAGQPLYTLSGKALLGETLISSVSSAANEVWASRFNGKPLTAENLISQTLSGAVNLPMVNEARVLGADKLLADTHLTPEPARAQTVEPASVQTATLRPEAAQAAVPEDPTMNRATLANETKLADGVFQRGNRVVLRSPELEVSLPPGWQFGPLAALEEQSGPGSGYISLTGHGALMPNDLREHKLPTLTKVPQGTRVVLLAPPGAVVGAKLGEAVNNRWFMRYDFETQKFLPIDIPFRVLEAGQSLPNYVISEPEGLDVPARTDIIAPRRGEVVLLSKTIQPNMGTVVINTCGYVKGAPTTQWSHLAFEPHRVLDRDRRLHGLPDTVINYGQPTDLSSAAGVSDALTFDSRARTDHPQRAEANTTAAPRLDPNGSLAHELFRQALETAPPSLYDVRGFESKDEAFAAVSRVLDEYNRLQQPHNGGIELTAAIFSITEGKTTSFHSTLVHKASVARDKDGKLQPVSLQVPAEVDARMVSKREAPDNAKPVERLRVPLPRNAVIVAMVHSHPLAGAVSPRAGPSQDDAIVLLERARTPAWGVDSSYIVERVQTPQGSVNVAMKLELKPAYWLAPDPRAIADGIGKGELDINDWVTLRYVQRPGDPPQSPVSLNVVSLDEASKSLRSHLLPHNVFGAAADSPHAPLIDWPFARSTEESTERQPSLQGLGIELPFLDRASRYAVAALRLPQTFVRRYGDNGLVSGELFRSMPTPRSADDHGAYLQEVKAWHRSLLTTLDFLLKHQRGGNEVQIADPVSGEPWSLREMVAGLRAELPRVQALGADSADHLQTATKLPKTLSPTLVVEPGPWHAENRGYKWDGKTHHVSPEPLDSPATRADEETALQDTNNQQSLQNDSKLPEASHARATLWTLSAEGAPQQVSQLPPLDPDHAYVMAVDFTGGAPKVGVLYGNDATVAGIRPAPLLRADSHRAAHRDVMRRLFPNTRADELQAVSKLVAVTAFAEGEGRLRLTFQSDFNFLPRHLRHAGHGSVNETSAGSTEHNRRLTPAATRLVAQVVADATGRNVFYAEPLSASKVAKLMDQPLFAMRGDELHDGPLVEVQPSQRSATPMPLVQRSTRPPRSAEEWRAAFNNARHLNEVRDAQGRTSIELELQAMAPHARTALSALKSELGPDTVQALLDGFFLGHVVDGDRSADGLLGVSAAWRARMGQQPLSGDTLATLIGAIGNLSDGVAVHDFEHLTVGYGTTPFEERLGRLLGAAAYHDTGQTDALAAAKAPLRNDAVFADLVRTRTAKLFALGADKPLGTTRPVASLFDEHFSYQTDHRSGVHQAATRFLDLLRQQGLFAHLRPDELDAISRSIFGESGSASIESVLSSRLPRDAFIATTHPILASIESVIQRASNRTLPRSRTDMLSLFSRELALQTLLVRHGFRFSEVDINQVLNSETQWTKARDAHGLGSIDFAGEFTDTYQEVRTAVDHVLRAAPGDDLHGDERKSVGAFAPARKAPSVADGTPFAPPLAKPSLPDAAIRVHAGVSALSPEVRRALEGEPSRWAPATPQQQQSSPPDRDAPKGLRAAWARAVTKGVKTIEQARNAYLRELAAYYRSGVNPALVNRRAFLDGLLHGKTHAVEFIEIPGVLKPINDHVGHVAADKLLAQVLDTAADVARQHTRVTVYQLDALRLAVEGSKSDVSAFADAFEARMQKLELGYVAHGIRYANKAQDDAADPSVREGLPVVRAQLGASAAGSRKELLAQGVEALDRASERLKRPEAEGGELDPERGAHLLKLKQTTAAANDEPLSAKDPGLDPELQPKDDERRATQQLSAAMLAALHEQTERVIGADPAQLPAYKRAIEDLVTKAFSTDDAFGRHLGNQLAFDRAVGERAFRFVRTLHGFIDVGAVGVTNRLVSRFGGDAVLTVVHATADKVAQRINQRMGLAGGKALEVFAVGGDEIRFISSELHVLRRFEKAFALAMRHATIDGTAGNTPAVRQPVQLSEIPVYIGVGKTKEEAEARSNAAKAGDPQRVPGRLPPSYVVGLTEQDMPWAKPPTPLPADIASADPAQLYRTDSSALSRLFAHGLSHPGATWHLVNSKDLPLARVTFDESGVAAYQRLERGGWTAAANLDHDHFVRLPERLGELFVSVDPVPPAWLPRLQKIDPAALPRGNASGLIDSATAFDRVLENAWLHRNMVASPRFRWELLTPNGQPSRSLDLARLQQQIELLAERSPGSEEQHGMGWQEFRNPGHQGGVTTFQIYASVQPDSAALVAREILDAAPAIGGLEGFKVARDEVKTALPANLMLYVSSQRGLHDVVSALRQIQSRHPEAFLQSSQAFAQEQLLPGVGYAQALDLPHRVIARRSSLETPTAMRFALVKRALQEVMQEGGNEADFRARLEQLLIEHNIDPQAPHLNLYNRGPRAIDMATFDPDALTKMPNLDAAARLQEELDAAAETLRANGHVAEASRLAAQAIVVRQALRNEQAARALRAGDVRNMLSPRDDSAENNAPQASDQSLRGADLSGRNLGGMNLSGADLRYANLHRSNLFGMDLHGANFTGANLADAGLSRADLGNANLTAANIGGAMLHLARLEDATLNNANLGGVQMKRAVLRGASADGADWSNADLHKSDFSNARLRSARLSDAQLGYVSFEGADLTGADIRGSEFYLPTMNLQSAKLEGLQADPRVLANLRRGAPPLEGVTLLKFHSDHTAKLVTRSASALPTLEQGGYLVVVAVPEGKGMQDGTVLMAPTSNALWNGDQRPPGAERKPQASHRVLAQNGVFQALSKDSVVLGATLMPEPPTDTVMGSAPRYRLSTQSWSVNSLINGYLGTRRIDPVVIDSSKPDIRPNDVYLPAEVSQPLAERLERDLGILITHLDGHPRHTALTHVAPPNDKQALQPLIDAGLLKNGTITADGVNRLAQARRELATEVGVDARAIELKVAALKIGQDHWHALIGRNAQAVDREHSYRSQLVQAMAPLNRDNAREQIGATSDSARQTQ